MTVADDVVARVAFFETSLMFGKLLGDGEIMKAILVNMVAAMGLMFGGSVLATDMPAIGKAKCGACHSMDKKMVGPAWNDVAKKYKGDPSAASKLATNITKGGEFGWKLGKMPPKGLGASDADIKSLAEFIAKLQ